MSDETAEAEAERLRSEHRREHHEVKKGHPSGDGWTTLQTFRTPALTRGIFARYIDRHIALSFWMWDAKKHAQGEDVEWEMTHEIVLEHHAVMTLNSVYLDGMRDQLDASVSDEPRRLGGPNE